MTISGTTTQGLIPSQTALADKKGLIVNSWYHWLKTIANNQQVIIDGGPYVSASGGSGITPNIIEGTYAEMGTGTAGDLYFTTDTGQIFINVGGEYTELIPAFTGDVTSTVGSTELTLATVNPITFGSFTNISALTVNEKGLVTFIQSGPSNTGAQGSPGTIQYAGVDGGFDGDQTNFFYSNNGTTSQVELGQTVGIGQLALGSGGALVIGDASGNLELSSKTGGLLINADGAISPSITSPNYGTAGQILTSTGSIGAPTWQNPYDWGEQTYTMAFSYGDVSPELITTIPSGMLIFNIELIIQTAFNGTSPVLTVGDSANYSSLMSSSQNLPSVAGTYETTPSFAYGSNTQIYISITPGSGTTQGNGYIVVRYQK